MKTHAIYVTQTPGRCRWCRCTEYDPCAGGCAWSNLQRTVCTECVPLDRALRTVPGRRALAQFVQAFGGHPRQGLAAATRMKRAAPAARRARRQVKKRG